MQSNPLIPGDLITMSMANGTGEGIIWRIKKVIGERIKIEVIWSGTGASVLRPKLVHWRDVEKLSLIDLGLLRQSLDGLIQGYVKLKSGAVTLDELESEENSKRIDQPSDVEITSEGGHG